MTSATRTRFAEVVRATPMDLGLACLLVGGEVEPDLDVEGSLVRLDELAATVSSEPPPAVGLQRALGQEAGFAGEPEDYDDLRSSLLHEVLRRRRGLPLLLSVVWLEVARRRQIPAYAAALPDRVVVGVGEPEGKHTVVDPFFGGRLLPGARVTPLDHVDLMLRLLTNVRALMDRQPASLEAVRTRLWAVELSLLLPRHPLVLRRQHGQLLVRLGDHLAGVAALHGYADLVEDADPDEATAARREARLAHSRLN
ncbi:MAG TPA: transglutaminase family protein [Mycobacteriales bacterium]|nr:transglutaminase family protein [Mycobacteriales bacterium]